MVKWQIGTYARLRPTRRGLENTNFFMDNKALSFPPPDEDDDRQSMKQRDFLQFNFNQVFDSTVSQEYIFEVVCQDIVRSALDGFNGTIFAYGQTGSGKTYTITGGEHYADRGIIPRVLSMIFEEFELRSEFKYACYISYLEIYNENVYDLLDRSHADRPIEEWTKVVLMDDDEGDMHFRNLGVYEAVSEEEALNLLFLGNMNRVTSDTPMNQASSRSHAIFSVMIESRTLDSPVINTSKLHLVDLAGSERVYKREGTQRMRAEGKHINLSLHHLEQVILSLNAKRGNALAKTFHVPYRNSMLTSVLRGSLGGNCKSVFIATLNPESEYVDESISTCRFMQRCSEVAVDVGVNQELDPERQVEKLQHEKNELLAQHQELLAKIEFLQRDNDELRAQMAGDKVVDYELCEALVEKLLACGEVPFREDPVDRLSVANTTSSSSAKGDKPNDKPNGSRNSSLKHLEGALKEIRLQEDQASGGDGLVSPANRTQCDTILKQIRAKGVDFAIGCLNVMKENTFFASNAVTELEESLNSQRRAMEMLEKRVGDQKSEAEQLKQQIRTLETQNQQQRQPVTSPMALPGTIPGGTPTTIGTMTSRVLRASDSGSRAGSRSNLSDEHRHLGGGGGGTEQPTRGDAKFFVAPNDGDQNQADDDHVHQDNRGPRLAKSSTMYLPPPPTMPPPPLRQPTSRSPSSRHNSTSPSELSGKNSTTDLIRKRTELLRNGNLFVKHGRFGRPHVRFVWCSSDLEYLYYRELTTSLPSVSIPTRSILRVLVGQQTRVFARDKRRGDVQDYCFSIEYAENRSLDLEVGDGESVEVKQNRRNEWVDALQFVLKMKTAQKQRSASMKNPANN